VAETIGAALEPTLRLADLESAHGHALDPRALGNLLRGAREGEAEERGDEHDHRRDE
jgi:hypothetical protein